MASDATVVAGAMDPSCPLPDPVAVWAGHAYVVMFGDGRMLTRRRVDGGGARIDGVGGVLGGAGGMAAGSMRVLASPVPVGGRPRRWLPWVVVVGADAGGVCRGRWLLGGVPLLASLTAFYGRHHLSGGVGRFLLGAPALVFACDAMVAFQAVSGLLPGRGIVEVEGTVLLSLTHERAARLGFSRAKACINIHVGGDALGVSFPRWVIIVSTLSCCTGFTLSIWTRDGDIFGVTSFLKTSFLETRLGLWKQLW